MVRRRELGRLLLLRLALGRQPLLHGAPLGLGLAPLHVHVDEVDAAPARAKDARQALHKLGKDIAKEAGMRRVELPSRVTDLSSVLVRVLRRKPVRRAQIYQMFIHDWLRHEASKGGNDRVNEATSVFERFSKLSF